MKMVFAINGLNKGGAQRVFANLMNYMVKKEVEVNLVMLNKTSINYDLSNKIKIYYVNNEERKKKNKLLTLIDFIFNKFKMKKILNQIHPDVILSFLPIMNFVSLWANNSKYPIIVSTRNDHNIEFPNKMYEFLLKKLYKKADGFIFQTIDQKEYFDSVNLKKEFKIIPNPINESFLIEPFKGKREKTIVSVGRLVEQKNQELIIRAFNDVREKIADYKLVIYGEGNIRNKLEALIKELNLVDKVFLPGNVDDIKNKIYESSLFILSSNYEGMPNALMEAMALGLPVISTDCPCGGPRSLIKNNENGILIPVNDREKLSSAILKVLNNREIALKLQKNAYDIQKELEPNKIYNAYYEFIKKIGDEHNE